MCDKEELSYNLRTEGRGEVVFTRLNQRPEEDISEEDVIPMLKTNIKYLDRVISSS